MAQNKSKLWLKKLKTVMQGAGQLLRAGFIKKIHFTTWLANVVMVPKFLGKWRMCVDFTYLNKTCLKDATHFCA